ncbi:hypothetical protein CEXT_633991 [Caerostris extrusa]|uniref:Uncharacterized protein n=1 Tax=Caerostris extrusa TaxID=172846 RepID=A0AAV4XU61_CAEEX|nr:hypothetical protein CEXT_633991 [Caerostris extrusa]
MTGFWRSPSLDPPQPFSGSPLKKEINFNGLTLLSWSRGGGIFFRTVIFASAVWQSSSLLNRPCFDLGLEVFQMGCRRFHLVASTMKGEVCVFAPVWLLSIRVCNLI